MPRQEISTNPPCPLFRWYSDLIISTLKVGQSLVIPTRATNGTLVSGNLAQCKTILNDTDSTFSVGTDNTIVPGKSSALRMYGLC